MKWRNRYQALHNKLGEIALRKHLYDRQVDKSYEERQSHMEVLAERNRKAKGYYEELASTGAIHAGDVFLELGAERAQRSLFLKDQYDIDIMALDLSFYSLKYSSKVKEMFGFTKDIPLLSADMYNLPFCNHSLPHIFCFETLHHFPDIRPVAREICRVLGQGEFCFDEEPFKRYLKTNIVPVKREPFTKTRGVQAKVLKYLKYWFLNWPLIEEEYKVIENYGISIEEYIDAFSIFDDYTINFTPIIPFVNNVIYRKGRERNHDPVFLAKAFLAHLAGGNVKGICTSHAKPSGKGTIGCPNCVIVRCDLPGKGEECLCPEICPEGALRIYKQKVEIDAQKCNLCLQCLYRCPRGRIDRNPLERKPEGFFCSNCKKSFPVVDGIHLLFSDHSFKTLYVDSGILDA